MKEFLEEIKHGNELVKSWASKTAKKSQGVPSIASSGSGEAAGEQYNEGSVGIEKYSVKQAFVLVQAW